MNNDRSYTLWITLQGIVSFTPNLWELLPIRVITYRCKPHFHCEFSSNFEHDNIIPIVFVYERLFLSNSNNFLNFSPLLLLLNNYQLHIISMSQMENWGKMIKWCICHPRGMWDMDLVLNSILSLLWSNPSIKTAEDKQWKWGEAVRKEGVTEQPGWILTALWMHP